MNNWNRQSALARFACPLVLMALAGSAHAQGPAPDYSDISYGLPGSAHPDQVLDFYIAPGNGPRPVVVWLFGGGFYSGTETINVSVPPFSDWMANGWSIASVRYRHSAFDCAEWIMGTSAAYPDHIQDTSLAVQYLRQQNGTSGTGLWDIDEDRILLYGRSAGGHLATWVAMADDQEAFGIDPLSPTYPSGHGAQWSTRVRAARNGGGPTDWTYDNPMLPSDRSPYFGWFFSALCSQLMFDVAVPPAVQEFASPVWQTDQGADNQNVSVWHQFNGLIGGNQHDPEYGVRHNDALLDIGSSVSYLNWNLGPDFPANEVVTQLEWVGLMNTSVPFGTGYAGSGHTPAISLVRLGTQDKFLVANVPAGTTVSLIVSLGEANVPLGGGNLYVDLSVNTVTLTAVANASMEAVFDTSLLTGAKGLFTLYAQAGWIDASDPGGVALTQGLRLHYEDL